MSDLEQYRHATRDFERPGSLLLRLADAAIAELGAENEKAWGERDHYLSELMERNTQLRKAESKRDALRDRRLPCREAEIAQKRYEDAEAERNALRKLVEDNPQYPPGHPLDGVPDAGENR